MPYIHLLDKNSPDFQEHVAGRESREEDNHQIKHWLSSHEDLLSPPTFKFTIIKTFQDPLTRQLSEAVRIERRGEDILNSKSVFSRCRVPRLRVDMEGWLEKQNTQAQLAGKAPSENSSRPDHSNQEEYEKKLQEEAEDSLAEQDAKRKAGDQEGKTNKRRWLEKVVGWGLPTSQEEGQAQQEVEQEEEPRITKMEDWTVMVKPDDTYKQGKVTKFAGKS